MTKSTRPSRSGRSSGETEREDATDRFAPRRLKPDRRSASAPAVRERRAGDDRRQATDRRQEEEGFTREESHRLEKMVRLPGNRALLLRGTRLSCPRCEGTLRLKRVADWKGAEPTWEIRCAKCRRSLFVRTGPDR